MPVAVVAVLLVLAGAAQASAAVRYVAPGGSTSADCTSSAAPCEISHGLSVAQHGDELSLAAGTYNVGDLTPSHDGLDIHGPLGTTDAHIAGNSSFAGLYENLRVSATGDAYGIWLAREPVAGWIDPVLRNSVVTSENKSALYVGELNTIAGGAQIDNVDASSSGGYALDIHGGANYTQTVGLVNDILRGGMNYTDGSQGVTLTASHTDGMANGLYGNAMNHLSGSGTGNIDTDPLYAGAGDFHETALSPTLDAGIADAADGVGGTDLDWGDRQAGAAPDMGADELAAATAEMQTAASNAQQNVAAAIGGLAPSTQYFFKLIGHNESGSFETPVQSFTTKATPPPPPATVDPAYGGGNSQHKLSVGFKGGTQKLKKHRLVFTLNPTSACRAAGTIGLGGKKLASFSKQLHAGNNPVTLKLSSKAIKALAAALKHKKTLTLKLKLTYNGASTSSHSLKLTR